MKCNIHIQEKRTEIICELLNGKITISLNPLLNLLLHTLSIYNMLGSHGKEGYTLKINEDVLKTIDSEIYNKIGGKEGYFGDGKIQIYSPTMKYIISNDLFNVYPTETILEKMSPEPFNEALIISWKQFYKTYWDANFDNLVMKFHNMNNNMNWFEKMNQMEFLTKTKWTDNMFVFPVEATGYSALTWGDNVCIGTLNEFGDAGFVHEGLHLLLKEQWAQDVRIKALIPNDYNDDFWGKSWEKKYEQALVVALDCIIRNKSKEYRKAYFEGCGVGDLYDNTFPLVEDYANNPNVSIEDLMLRVIEKSK